MLKPSSMPHPLRVICALGALASFVGIATQAQAANFTVGGTVARLASPGLVLQNNGGDNITIAASGAFIFPTALPSGASYNVTVKTQPSFPAQTCVIKNPSGTIANANISGVAVLCANLPQGVPQAEAGVRGATVSWTNPGGASSFNVYVSSTRNCDVRNYTSCANASLFANVTSPYAIAGLHNGVGYFIQVEQVYASGTRGVLSEVNALPNALSFDGAVTAAQTATNGTVYMGGQFTRVGIGAGSAAPLTLDTGKFVASNFPIVDGPVFSAIGDGAGGWYLGGLFKSVGGLPRTNLAHILANGAVDTHWSPNVSGAVSALGVLNNTVYAGGGFQILDANGNVVTQFLASFDSNGALLPWRPIVDSVVESFAVANNTLYVGGAFSSVTLNGQTFDRRSLVAFDANGAVTAWSPHTNGDVQAIAIAGTTIYVGGNFLTVNGIDHTSLAAIDAGGAVLAWNPIILVGRVTGLAVANGIVYAGGDFTSAGGSTRNHLAAFDNAGALTPWNPNVDGGASVIAISGNTIYAGGRFTHAAGVERNFLAAFDTSGALLPWNPNPDHAVRTFALSGGTLYTGGEFEFFGGASRNFLAAIDASGNLTAWNPGADSFVVSIGVSATAIYAGGSFSHVGNGIARNHAAAFDLSGAVTAWNPNVNARVNAIAVWASDTIYIGGEFSTVGGSPRRSLARIHADGSLDAWDPSPNATVTAIAPLIDDAMQGPRIWVAGFFTGFGPKNIPRNGVAAIFDSSNELVPVDLKVSGLVSSLAVGNDLSTCTPFCRGMLYVGGDFTQMGGQSRNSLAAVRPDGSLSNWAPSVRSVNKEGSIVALAVSTNSSTVYASGTFDHINGVARENIGAVSSVDATTSPWHPHLNNAASSLTTSNTLVNIGGNFTSMNNTSRAGFGSVDPTSGDFIP